MNGSEKYVLISTVASIILTFIKGFLAFITNSLSILAESFDSLLDIINLVFGYIAIKVGKKPPDESHPYGHEKIESLVAYTEVIFIFLISLVIIYEGFQRIIFLSVLSNTYIGIIVLFSTLIVDGFLSYVNFYGSKKYNSPVLKANYINYLGDVFRTFAVIFALFLAFYNFYIFDIVISFLLAGILIYEAIGLLKESLCVLLDTAPREVIEEVRRITLNTDGVRNVRNIRARKVGEKIFVDIIITVDNSLKIEDAHKVASNIENVLYEKFGNVDVIVHIEPSRVKMEQ